MRKLTHQYYLDIMKKLFIIFTMSVCFFTANASSIYCELIGTKIFSATEEFTIDDCKKILRQAFEVGPENNQFHMVIFNNRKIMRKSGFIDMDNFENRIGTKMSTDDSWEFMP